MNRYGKFLVYNLVLNYTSLQWFFAVLITLILTNSALSQSITYAVDVDFTNNSPRQEVGAGINVGPNNLIRGFTFSPDGSTMFTIDNDGNDIQQYSLDIPFDLNSTVTLLGSSPPLQTIAGVGIILPEAIEFNSEGTVLFVLESNDDRIIQFNLGIPYSVISGSLNITNSYQGELEIGSEETTPRDLTFNNDGSKLFVVGNQGDDVNEYSLSNTYDVINGSINHITTFSVGSEEGRVQGIAFDATGKKCLSLAVMAAMIFINIH